MAIHQEVTLHKWMAASSLIIQEFLDTAVMLAEMVYHIHKQNETIGALNPHHIKIRPWLKQAVVTDTTKFSAAYRSPDYTGTMNRVPDALSDLYSLGVIFYELLTGQLPIQPRNAEADWAFAHVAERPSHIHTLLPESAALLGLASRLMNKNDTVKVLFWS